jgi:hypothetical protein
MKPISIGIAVAVIAAAGLGIGIVLISNASQSPSVTSSTLPCGRDDVKCGKFNVTSIDFTTSSVNFTLTNTGQYNLDTVVLLINRTEVAKVQGLAVGQTYTIQIPPSFHIVAGQDYEVTIDSTIGLSGGQITVLHLVAAANLSTTTSSICISPGQSAGLFVRVLSDSMLNPIVGANVTAAHDQNVNCGPGTIGGSTSLVHKVQTFLTNSTEWYQLDTLDSGDYSFTVTYSNHTYGFTAPVRPMVYTCATLYIPSGRTNATTTGETPCAPGS